MVRDCNVHFCLVTAVLICLFRLNIHIGNNIKSCSCWYGNILIFWSVIYLIFADKLETVICSVSFKNSNGSFRKWDTQTNWFWVDKLNFICWFNIFYVISSNIQWNRMIFSDRYLINFGNKFNLFLRRFVQSYCLA